MKCFACGYRHNHWDADAEDSISDGHQKFIRLHSIQIQKEGNYYSYDQDVKLSACPKCGTVRMDEV